MTAEALVLDTNAYTIPIELGTTIADVKASLNSRLGRHRFGVEQSPHAWLKLACRVHCTRHRHELGSIGSLHLPLRVA